MESRSQKRIMLWASPRTVSTAFLFSMDRVDKCKVICEPYTMAYFAGDDRVVTDNSIMALNARFEGYSFQTARNLLERKYEESDVVFAKDLAFAIGTDHIGYLPSGYQHTFLIRHPDKVLRSAYNLYTNDQSGCLESNIKFPADPIAMAITRGNYKVVWDLANYVKNELGQELVVIDSDELCSHPEKILPLYCEKIGIKYTPNMLSWPKGGLEKMTSFLSVNPEQMPNELVLHCYSNAMKSTGFSKKNQDFNENVEFLSATDIPPNLQDIVKDNLVYYQSLFEQRLMPRS